MPPDLEFEREMEVWIAEGVFDAAALRENGLAAISAMSSNNIPTAVIEEKKDLEITWVIALNNDPINANTGKNAGLEAAKKMKATIADEMRQKTKIALPPTGMDWNDLHGKGRLDADTIDEAFWRGRLLTAENAVAYGRILAQKKGLKSFVFDYKNRIYAYEVKQNRRGGMETDCYPISNFTLELLYARYDGLNEVNTFCFEFTFANGNKRQRIELTAGELRDNSSFEKRVLTKTGSGSWEGQPGHLRKLNKKWFRTHPQTIMITQVIGYHEESDAYIFNDFAYDRTGRLILPNQSGFCDIPGYGGLQTVFKSNENEEIFYCKPTGDFSWIDDLLIAYGGNGMAALSFFSLSLFAEQIFRELMEFPFFAMIGEKGAGKTTLLRFLWKLLGRNKYEGLPMSGRLTDKAVGRTTARASNLPTVYIEANNVKHNFNFESMLPWLNRNPIGAGATKDYTLNTHTLPFRTAIVIAQNKPIEGSPALIERFVNTEYDKRHFTEEGRQAGDRLKGYSGRDVSGYLHELLSNRDAYFDDILGTFQKSRKLFRAEGLKNSRAVDYNALVYAGWSENESFPIGRDCTRSKCRPICWSGQGTTNVWQVAKQSRCGTSSKMWRTISSAAKRSITRPNRKSTLCV